MAKQAKEKENLDFFYLGEKKVEPNKSKNKNVVKSKNETKTVSPKKKSKNKKNEPMDLDNEIIIGLKRIEDKPVKKQKSTKKRNSNIKSQNSKDKNKSKITKNKPRNSNTIKDRKQYDKSTLILFDEIIVLCKKAKSKKNLIKYKK